MTDIEQIRELAGQGIGRYGVEATIEASRNKSSGDAERELKERARGNAWLVAHGFEAEQAIWSKGGNPMSMNEHETHAAVVAEMRGADNKCQFATKNGTGCYHCPFGSAASNCLFDKFANRAEAVHKREVEKLNSVIQATISRSDAEIDRLRREAAELRKQIGNAAKLREALQQAKVAILAARKKMGVDNPIILEIIDTALAKPPRNCDRFNSGDAIKDGKDACDAWYDEPDAMRQHFSHWILSEVANGKDETDASK